MARAKSNKKNSDTLNQRLALVFKSGKISLGYRSTLKALRQGKAIRHERDLLKPPDERHRTWRPPAKQSSILQIFRTAKAQESMGESTQTAPLSLDPDDPSSGPGGSVMEAAMIEDGDATDDEDWASIGAKALRNPQQ
ncbi:hypothetical protein MY11210_007480 [Beauveria gryllotalpidicola]